MCERERLRTPRAADRLLPSAMTKSDFLERALGNQVSIPTLPVVVQRINAMMTDPEIGLRDIGREVAKDAPIATKVLRIANSAFYGLREKVVSTEHAASVLGLRVLKNLVLQASVIAQFEHLAKLGGFDLEAQWRHSIAVAQFCQELTRGSGVGFALGPDEFYSCGLLHDIGKVVLLDNLAREYVEVVQSAAKSGRPIHVVEDEQLGFDHAAIGARVAQTWGLPDVLVRAIGMHHGKLETLLADNPNAAVVATANAIVHRLEKEPDLPGIDAVKGLVLGPLGLEPTRAAQIVGAARRALAADA
jgi:putative nucleotidyltransferase with HDIG domain